MDNLTSITIYGSGANFGLGQSNNANDQWPRTNLNDYVRSIDFASSTSRATAVTWAAPVTAPVAPCRAPFSRTSRRTTRPGRSSSRSGRRRGASSRARRRTTRRCGGASRRAWQEGRHLDDDAEGAVGDVVQGRRLHQRAEPGDARGHVARESDLRRHAGRERLQQLPRGARRRDVPGQHGAEARRPADVRGADPRRQHEPVEYRAARHASASTGGARRRPRRTGRAGRSAADGFVREAGRRRLSHHRRLHRAWRSR